MRCRPDKGTTRGKKYEKNSKKIQPCLDGIQRFFRGKKRNETLTVVRRSLRSVTVGHGGLVEGRRESVRVIVILIVRMQWIRFGAGDAVVHRAIGRIQQSVEIAVDRFVFHAIANGLIDKVQPGLSFRR